MSPRIQRIADHMNSNLHRKLSLNDLARSANLSRSRMSYLFKTQTGMSPGLYLKTLRLKKACELLETTSISIKEVRANVGMQDQSHFIREFKRVYGVTPSQYRAKQAS